MGMYDYVRLDRELLPVNKEMDEFLCGLVFQTKSFNCMMDEYRIAKDGIYKLSCDWVEVPKEERPFPNAKKGSLMAWAGSTTRVNERWLKLGDIEPFQFYISTSDAWMEFECSFLNGEILIKDISVQARIDNEEKSKAIKEYLDKLDTEEN